MTTSNNTARTGASEPEAGLLRLVETIAGQIALANAFDILCDYHIARDANQSALQAGEKEPVKGLWKLEHVCRSYLGGLREAGWTAESNDELFFILWPDHPSHPALLKVLATPRGEELRAHIEAGYLACWGDNWKNAVPIARSTS